MPDMNENAETQQEYFGKAKLETDYKDLSMRLYKRIAGLEKQIEEIKCCGNCRFSESDKLNGTFCHREGCFVVASAKCKLWER